MRHHLAQVNIAQMRGEPGAEVMAGLVARIDEMNQLAERSQGFIWRMRGSEVTPDALRAFADYFVPFEPERLFYYLSVWESVEHLREYAFGTAHAEMLRHKHEWIEHLDRGRMALRWVPVGHIPNIAESVERLQLVQANGATPFAFTFCESFPEPSRPPAP